MIFTVAGDCRGILVQKDGKCKVMSYDHKPNRYVFINHLIYHYLTYFNYLELMRKNELEV